MNKYFTNLGRHDIIDPSVGGFYDDNACNDIFGILDICNYILFNSRTLKKLNKEAF